LTYVKRQTPVGTQPACRQMLCLIGDRHCWNRGGRIGGKAAEGTGFKPVVEIEVRIRCLVPLRYLGSGKRGMFAPPWPFKPIRQPRVGALLRRHGLRTATGTSTSGTTTSGPGGSSLVNVQRGSPQPTPRSPAGHTPAGLFAFSKRLPAPSTFAGAGLCPANPRGSPNSLRSHARSLKLFAKLIQIIARYYFI
jgi:hypothetical protein